MDVTSFNIKFSDQGQMIVALCHVMKPMKYYQYRIQFQRKGKDSVLIMYKINQPNQMFFWFPVSDENEHVLRSISKILEEKFKN